MKKKKRKRKIEERDCENMEKKKIERRFCDTRKNRERETAWA